MPIEGYDPNHRGSRYIGNVLKGDHLRPLCAGIVLVDMAIEHLLIGLGRLLARYRHEARVRYLPCSVTVSIRPYVGKMLFHAGFAAIS
jgi:hypothetical protein